jgi:hypothetical protein
MEQDTIELDNETYDTNLERAMTGSKKDVFEFNPVGHKYTLNGKRLTGVTTILGVISKGDGLIQWSANEAVRFISEVWKGGVLYTKKEIPAILTQATKAWVGTRDTAGDKGKDLHAIIEELVKKAIDETGGLIEYKESEDAQLNHFLKWAADKRFLESEKSVYSKSLFFAGTLDIVYEKDGEVYLADIKTAKSIYPTNYWQMSAYQFCLQEMGLYPKIKGFTVVRLGKDGTNEIGENYSYDDNIQGFLAALTIYRKLNAITPKK